MSETTPVDSETAREIARAVADEVSQRLRHDLAEIGYGPSDSIDLAERWSEGELVMRPESGQEKAIPMESFCRKIVLARERLRVLEQKINNHPKLDDGDRMEMQKYITQIYGSFTSFNVLFSERMDWFVGQKGNR